MIDGSKCFPITAGPHVQAYVFVFSGCIAKTTRLLLHLAVFATAWGAGPRASVALADHEM